MDGAQNALFTPQITLPVITSAAMFVSILFLDLTRLDFELLPMHTLFGIISTLLVSVICSNGYSMVAWGLLMIPLVVILIGSAAESFDTPAAPPVAATTYPTSGKFAPFSRKTKCAHRRT